MGLEVGTYISDLVTTNPAASDAKSYGDDHIRLIKSTVKASFPNITGAVTPTQTELNYMVGATTNPAMKDGSNLTTPALGDSSLKIATTAFVAGTAFSSALPSQTGNSGKFVTTNGTTASWADVTLTVSVVSGTTQTAVANYHYILTNVAATTVTLPASPSSGDTIWITWANSLTTNVVARNGQTIMGASEDMTLDALQNGTVQLRFVNSSWRIL